MHRRDHERRSDAGGHPQSDEDADGGVAQLACEEGLSQPPGSGGATKSWRTGTICSTSSAVPHTPQITRT
jgi:hypothetical protein